MDRLSYPSVHVQQIPCNAQPLTGAPTSVAAFIGRTSTGPVDKAVRVRRWSEFTNTFGGALPGRELSVSIRLFFENGGTECQVVRVGGDEPIAADILGSKSARTGMYALDAVSDVNILILPSDTEIDLSGAWAPASQYCARRGAFLLIDPPAGWTRAGRAEAAHNPYLVDELRRGADQDHCAAFYPRLMVSDEGEARAVGPSGAVAGLMARTDAEKGVWASMAGLGADLRSVDRLEVELDEREVNNLTVQGVNPLLRKNGKCVSWGNLTFRSLFEPPTGLRYIPVARTKMFLEGSVRRGTQWTVFELNDEVLWAKVRTHVTEFMLRLWRFNAFVGDAPSQSFYVKCDAETTAIEDRARGVLNLQVGFAPLRPAEFLVIRVRCQAVPAAPPAPTVVRPTLNVGRVISSSGRTTNPGSRTYP